MKNRKQRVELMVDLIKNKCIGSQEELARLLEEAGYTVTQATLSRDLKMLKTTKIPTDRGGYMYILPDSNSLKDKLLARGQLPINSNYQSGFISLTFSKNVAVIKTRNLSSKENLVIVKTPKLDSFVQLRGFYYD